MKLTRVWLLQTCVSRQGPGASKEGLEELKGFNTLEGGCCAQPSGSTRESGQPWRAPWWVGHIDPAAG